MQEHVVNLEAMYSKIQKQDILPILYFLMDYLNAKTYKTSESSVSFTCLIIQSQFHSVSTLNVGKWTQQSSVTQHYATACFQLNVSCNSKALL